MYVRVITPPEPVVTLEEAKKHLRVLDDDSDDLIDTYIAAATEWLDGPAGWLGRALGVQTLELVADRFGDGCREWIGLAYPPFIDVVSVKYIDGDGVETTMPVDGYELALGQLRPAFDGQWPSHRYQSDAVRIRYRAGYGALDASSPPVLVNAVPKPIKVAILMLVDQYFNKRDGISIGASVETMPFAVDQLLSPYRVFR